MSKKRANEFRQERIDYANSHKIAEKQVLPIFRKALDSSIKHLLDQIKTNGVIVLNPELYINQNVWSTAYQQAFELLGMKFARKEFYRQRSLEPNANKSSAIEFLLDVWNSKLRDYALTYTYRIQRELNDTTIEIIKRALGDVYELGIDSDAKIRLFLKDVNAKFRLRSRNISRTEATTISNLGKDIGARGWIEQQGGQGYKAWLGRNDKKERHTHLEENNTILPIDEPHIVGGEEAERPGDINLSAKERINCRCTETYMSQNRYNALVKRGRIVNGRLVGASGSDY